MKKQQLLLILLALTACFNVWAQSTSVKGKLIGFNANQSTFYLSRIEGNRPIPVDTITVNAKGEYNFDVKIEKPQLYILQFVAAPGKDLHLMLLPKEKISLDIELWKKYPFVRIFSTKGSKNLTTYMEFNHAISDSMDILTTIDNEYVMASTTEERKAEIAEQFKRIQVGQNQRIKRLLENSSDCLISAFLVTYFEQDFATYADLYEKIYNSLKTSYADDPFVGHLQQKIATSLAAGSLAPEIDMKDPEGNNRKLSDLRGKIVMIDFWASWCGPCRRENPNVVKLYKKYHDAGFEIYSVSLDRSKDEWLRAIQQDGLEWPNHVSDLRGWTSSGGAAYGVMSVPTTVLIDKQGRIIAKNLRGADLENKLKELFGF